MVASLLGEREDRGMVFDEGMSRENFCSRSRSSFESGNLCVCNLVAVPLKPKALIETVAIKFLELGMLKLHLCLPGRSFLEMMSFKKETLKFQNFIASPLRIHLMSTNSIKF